MKIAADENIDGRLVAALRDAGHDVFWIAESLPSASDAVVLETAREQGALLLTDDLDFGEMVYRQQLAASGVLLTRLAGLSLGNKIELILQTLEQHAEELNGSFTVIDKRLTRIRPFRN